MKLDALDRTDPLFAAGVAVLHLKALLDAMHAVTRPDRADHYGSDPMQTLTDLARTECERIAACMAVLLQEIEDGRMPARPGQPGQYGLPPATGGPSTRREANRV